jgi:hypothetical protein
MSSDDGQWALALEVLFGRNLIGVKQMTDVCYACLSDMMESLINSS